jgi:hypothetical protein
LFVRDTFFSSNTQEFYAFSRPIKTNQARNTLTRETMTKMRAGVVGVIGKGSTGKTMTRQMMTKMRAGLVGVIVKGSAGGGLVATKAGARRGWLR